MIVCSFMQLLDLTCLFADLFIFSTIYCFRIVITYWCGNYLYLRATSNSFGSACEGPFRLGCKGAGIPARLMFNKDQSHRIMSKNTNEFLSAQEARLSLVGLLVILLTIVILSDLVSLAPTTKRLQKKEAYLGFFRGQTCGYLTELKKMM